MMLFSSLNVFILKIGMGTVFHLVMCKYSLEDFIILSNTTSDNHFCAAVPQHFDFQLHTDFLSSVSIRFTCRCIWSFALLLQR